MALKPLKPRNKPVYKPYTPPALTDEDREDAKKYAEKIVRKNGPLNLGKILVVLCLENIRLLKEIQDHRAARGFKPAKEF